MFRNKLENINIFILTGGLLIAAFLFLHINFEETIGSVFGIMSVALVALYVADVVFDKRTIEIESDVNRGRTVFGVAVAFFAYMIITYLVLSIVNNLKDAIPYFATLTGVQSITSLNSLNQVFIDSVQALIFQGNVYLSTFALSIPVPIAETLFFFVVLFELVFINALSINPYALSLRLGAAFLLIAIAFMFYHANAKGLDNDASIISTLVFALVSMGLIFWERQAIGAILLHISANFSALVQKFQLWPSFLNAGVFAIPIAQTIFTVGFVLLAFYALSLRRYIPQLTG